MSLILGQGSLLAKSAAASRNVNVAISVVRAVIPGPGQVRFRKINISRPHQPDFFRKQLLAISKPEWDEHVPIEAEPLNCQHEARYAEKEVWLDHVNQLEKFYVEELKEMFNSSSMIAFYHSNPIARCNFRKAWQNGRRMGGMELVKYNYRVGKAALRGTEWENCLHFFPQCYEKDHEQPILFSSEVKPKNLLSFEKKVPEFHLIGAVIHNRILSRAQVMDLVNTPDLDQQRAELVSILGANQAKLVQLLSSNQSQLSRNLEQYVKDSDSSIHYFIYGGDVLLWMSLSRSMTILY